MERLKFSSGTYWEEHVGYSRAVKVGNMVFVSGTTAIDGETIVGKNDAYMQTKYIIEKIENALTNLGAKLEDVVRIRIYLTDITLWKEAAKAYSEFFKNIKPSTDINRDQGSCRSFDAR